MEPYATPPRVPRPQEKRRDKLRSNPSTSQQGGSPAHQTSTASEMSMVEEIRSEPSEEEGEPSSKRNPQATSSETVFLLLIAATGGDFGVAQKVFRNGNPVELASLALNQNGDTVLHVAAARKHTQFVILVLELLGYHSKNVLEVTNSYGITSFLYAVASGVVEIATEMCRSNENLPTLRGPVDGWTPLYVAAMFGHKEMVSFLCSRTFINKLNPKDRLELLEMTMHKDMFDATLLLLKGVELTLEVRASLLRTLATKPITVTSYNRKQMFLDSLLQHIPLIKSAHHDFRRQMAANNLLSELLGQFSKPGGEIPAHLVNTNILHVAVEMGNVEFVTMVLRIYPDLITSRDENGHSIFHVAVAHRQEKVFNLIYDMGAYKDLMILYTDHVNMDILKLAAKLPERRILEAISGPALQMQRELLWFKEVEKIVPPSSNKRSDKSIGNIRESFSSNHEPLLKESKKWMRDTANNCMLVATLIATVVFAAAFQVPGGSDNKTGTPLFLEARWFKAFVISDAVALFSSTTSIIVFLSILTSSYAEEDFLVSLPTKLMLGLTALFFAIVSMVVAFISTFFMIYEHNTLWMPKLIGTLACIPVSFFALLQYKLWLDTIRSTYWSKFLFRPSKHTVI